MRLRNWLVGCLLLLSLSPLGRLLLLDILLQLLLSGVHVGRRRIRRLRGRELACPLILPERHQELNLLEYVFLVVEVESSSSKLQQSLSFFLSELPQKLVHKPFVIDLLHFGVGRLLLHFGGLIGFINEALQILLGVLVR